MTLADRRPVAVVSVPEPAASSERRFRLVLAAILLGSLALQTIRLDRQGFGNPYYAAAVRSMLQGWHTFFFASFDPTGWVSVDKPPLGLWLQAASARLLGYHGFSLLLPQALAMVASVALLGLLVRQAFGNLAGLAAALALALTPVSVAVARTNQVDAVLVLFLLLGAASLLRGIDDGGIGWLLLAAALVGLGFNVKMLQAYLVVPAFALAWLVAAHGSLGRRLGQLVGAAAVLLAVSLAWAVAVDLTPPDQRPYVGSSSDNSVLNLVLGYNGLQRLLPPRLLATGPLAALGTGGRPGPGIALAAFGPAEVGPGGVGRLLTPAIGGQASWLLPLAVVGLLAAARQARRAADPASRRRQVGSLLLWGGWLLTTWGFFSVASEFHRYYLTMFGLPVAACAGIGLAALWRDWQAPGRSGWLLPATIAFTSAYALRLLGPHPYWLQRVGPPVGLLGFGSALALAVLRGREQATAARSGGAASAALAAGIVALLAAPLVWSAHALWEPVNNVIPVAGPDAGFPFARSGTPGSPPPGPPGDAAEADFSRADPKLVAFLADHGGGARYALATANALAAAPLIIETGAPVVPLGGFIGLDPIASNDRLAELVRSGEMRWFLVPDPAEIASLAARLNGAAGSPPGGPEATPATGPPPAVASGGAAPPAAAPGSPAASGASAGEFLTFLVSDNAKWVAANCARVPPAAWRSDGGAANPMDALSAMFDCGGLRQP